MGNDQSTQRPVDFSNVARTGSLVSRRRHSSMVQTTPSSQPPASRAAPPPYSVIAENPPPSFPEPGHVSPSSPTNTNPFRSPQSPPAPSSHRRVLSQSAYNPRAPVPPRSAFQSPGSGHTRTPANVPPQSASVTRRNSREDPLLMLRKYDTIIVVDDSSSMAGALWFEAREALAGIAELAGKHDSDGIDIHFLNDTRVGSNMSSQDVKRLFDRVSPDGITPTGEKLEILLLDYLLKIENAKELADKGDPTALNAIKPVNYIVITDGAPTDDPESVIVTAARRLDAGRWPITQVGIQFVQIGNDPDAADALRELDDDLGAKYGVRDIVDCTLFSGHQLDPNTLTKILLGGINRRIDKRGVQ